METNDLLNIGSESSIKESLEEKFNRERLEWTDKIDKMSGKIKQIFEIPELMTYLYTERQRVVEYYHYLASILVTLNRKYNAAYAERYDYYTVKSAIRYPNETTKNNKIRVDLADQLEKRELINNHMHFMDKTIGTIDNIIFAIPRRVEIEQISRGK